MRVGVLALQGDVREHMRVLGGLGAEASLVRRPADLGELDGLVLPGGESTVIDKLTRAFGIQGPIRAAIGEGLPVYGTCAGLILLADRVDGAIAGQQGFGGLDITVRRNAFGSQAASFETSLTVTGVDGPVPATFIRAPLITAVGAGVRVLARLDRSLGGGVVAVQQGPLLGTAFHPEVTGDARLHELFLRRVRESVATRR